MGLPEKYSLTSSEIDSGRYLLDCYQSSIDSGELYPDPYKKSGLAVTAYF